MPYKNTPQKSVVLEKVRDLKGELPRGHIFMYTYKSLSDDMALPRARKALQREHRDEDPLDWKAVQ